MVCFNEGGIVHYDPGRSNTIAYIYIAFINNVSFGHAPLFMSIPRKPRFNCLSVTILGLLAALVSGCSTTSGVQLAGAAIGAVLEATGVIKKDSGDPSKKVTDLSLKLFAGEQLNTTSNGKSLSLVMKIYTLRSPERLKMLTSPEISTPESEKEALGDSLISVREITVIPGKSYDLQLRVPGDATTIGIVGMFRAPFSYRWKLAFDAKNSFDTGIIVGAHACALTASKGALVSDISPDSVRSLIGVQCNQ